VSQPFTVQPGNGSNAGTTVVSVDSNGNELVTGTLTTGPIILPKVSTAPGQTPLSLTLYSDDGTTLKFIGAGGVAGGVAVSGPLTATNGGTLSGTFNETGMVITGAPDFRGTTAATTVLTTDVTGDTNPRLTLGADGKISWGPGNGATDTNWYRGSAGVVTTDSYTTLQSGQTNGNFTVFGTSLSIGSAGGKFFVKEGTNASMGTGTLNGTTEVTVATTKVTATSRIFLTIQAPAGTAGGVAYVSSRVAGTSFGVKALALDTSTFAWLIVEPA
jgi:hypothetical protein